MDEDVDEQRLNDYGKRITVWIGRQGLLFQIRYLRMAGTGSILTRFVSLFTALAIWLSVLLVVGFFAYKFYRDSDLFKQRLNDRISDVLGLESLESKGFFRSAGNGGYQMLRLTGGEETFFDEGKFTDFEGPFSIMANVLESWNPPSINMRKAELTLKGGGEEDEMRSAVKRILASMEQGSLKRIKVADFNCEWGYSKLTLGGIYNSRLEASLVDGEWQVSLKGGYFRQNWLGPMFIEKGELSVNRDGIAIQTLRLTEGSGIVELSGEISGPLSVPTLSMGGTFSNVAVEKLFRVKGVREDRFLEGGISGELEISGSTNRSIEMSGKVELAEGDELRIRDEWKLISALAAVSRDGGYRRIGFDAGSFKFKTGNGRLEVSDISLLAANTAKLEGGFSTRFFSQQEAADFLDIVLTSGFSEDLTDTSSARDLENDRISLRRATSGSGEDFEVTLNFEEDLELEEVLESEASIEEIDGLRLKREMARPRYSGTVNLLLPGKTFEKTEKVANLYEADGDGWVVVPIVMDLDIFTEISEKTAEELLEAGKTYRSGSNEGS